MGLISRVSSRTYRYFKMEAASAAPNELIEQFCSITGADKGKASFFLAAAGNDLNTAMNEYFSSNQGPRIATMNTSSTSSPGQQELYAGGASRQGGSGQNIIGGNKKPIQNLGEDSEAIVRNVFSQAREAGAE